jgi:hypothetical protein
VIESTCQQAMAGRGGVLSEPARSEFNPKDFILVVVHVNDIDKAQGLAEKLRREAVVREDGIRQGAVEREARLRCKMSDLEDETRRGAYDCGGRSRQESDDPVQKLD